MKISTLIWQIIRGYKPLTLPKNLVIETKRFTLTPLKKEDTDAAFLTMNCQVTAETISFMHWPMTKEQASKICSTSARGLAWKRGFILLGRNREDSFPIGCVGLFLDEKDCKTAEVGYWVTENWQGRGCATELLQCMIDFAFKSPCQLSRLIALVLPENSKSRNVLEKQGFQRIGSKKKPTVKGSVLDFHLYELKNPQRPLT